jgi:DNA-binding IclR family transcriptional regulator
MGGLDRAAAILGAFDATHRELTLAALVARSSLPRSTTHRIADRMIRLGWLDKPKDRYRIGNRLFEISSLAPIRHELREAALPFLQDLHAAVKTTVQLGVLEGAQVLVVERITGHRPMPMLEQAGGKIPVHCSGLGRAILAYSDPATIEAILSGGLPARTPRTLTSPVAILRELTAIPARGWAVDREEGNIGISCVAAPIFGPLGQVAAAVSVTGPTGLVRAERIGPAVRLAAAAVSRAYSTRRLFHPALIRL